MTRSIGVGQLKETVNKSSYNGLGTATTMFYLIGLGLYDEKDITFRGLEVSINYHMSMYSLERIIPSMKGRS